MASPNPTDRTRIIELLYRVDALVDAMRRELDDDEGRSVTWYRIQGAVHTVDELLHADDLLLPPTDPADLPVSENHEHAVRDMDLAEERYR